MGWRELRAREGGGAGWEGMIFRSSFGSFSRTYLCFYFFFFHFGKSQNKTIPEGSGTFEACGTLSSSLELRQVSKDG